MRRDSVVSPAIPFAIGALFLLLGVITLGYAVPGRSSTHDATVLSALYLSGGRYQGDEWNVTLDVSGVGGMVADSHSFYDVARHFDGEPHVVATLRGGQVETIRYQGHDYDTAQASRNTQFIEAAVLLALTALMFGLGVRQMRRRRQISVGSPAESQTTRSPSDEPASTRSASERG